MFRTLLAVLCLVVYPWGERFDTSDDLRVQIRRCLAHPKECHGAYAVVPNGSILRLVNSGWFVDGAEFSIHRLSYMVGPKEWEKYAGILVLPTDRLWKMYDTEYRKRMRVR